MACESWQEAISAVVDGEVPAIAPELVDAHLRRCSSCQELALQVMVDTDSVSSPSSVPTGPGRGALVTS